MAKIFLCIFIKLPLKKSLQYDYQRLGLALALTEYGLSCLAENEMYFIDDNSKTEETRITKRTFKNSPSTLRDWS